MRNFAVLGIAVLAFCSMNYLIQAIRPKDREKANFADFLASFYFALMMLFLAMLINS